MCKCIHTQKPTTIKNPKLATTIIKTQLNKAETKTSPRKPKPQQKTKPRFEKTQHSAEQHLQNMQVLLSNTYFQNYKFK